MEGEREKETDREIESDNIAQLCKKKSGIEREGGRARACARAPHASRGGQERERGEGEREKGRG